MNGLIWEGSLAFFIPSWKRWIDWLRNPTQFSFPYLFDYSDFLSNYLIPIHGRRRYFSCCAAADD